MRITSLVVALIAAALFIPSLTSRSGDIEAGTAVRMDVAELVMSSELILEGRILSRQSFLAPSGHVETEYLLGVERTFEGADFAYRSVRLPGGVLEDGSGMILAGMPHLGAGEDVLLFLTVEGSTGIRMPVGLSQGKFNVGTAADGTKVLARDQGQLALVNRETGELIETHGRSVRDYAEVVAEIEAALARKRGR
jgi:hypothetical protein